MLKIKSLRSQRGDTILEVIIAAAVLTLVLTIAYTAANRGSQSVRQAQERGESSRHTETQIELLKAYVSNSADPSLPQLPPTSGGNFCMKNDGTPIIISGAIPTNAQAEVTQQYAAFSQPGLDDCKKDGLYFSYIERNGNTFIAHTRWNKVNGRGIDEVTMTDRIFPDLASAPLATGGSTPGCPINFFFNAVGGCTPCPVGFSSPGGFSSSCAPIPARIEVYVDKIPPIGSSSPPCSNAGSASSGTGVRLNGPGGPFNGTSTATFDVNFSSTYNGVITAMPNGFELCSSPPAATSTPIGTPASSNLRTMRFTIRPRCDTAVVTDNWTYEPVAGSFYADQTGWNSYWVQGEHLAELSTYAPTGTPDGVYADARSPTGYTWFIAFAPSSKFPGYSYYNGWVAYWQSDPVYGEPYYHSYQWVNRPTTSYVCEP